MTWRHLALGAGLMMALTTPVLTQNLGADLQRANERAAKSGDCKSVLPEYARIVEQGAKSDRAAAAEALYRAGVCHEALGDGKAQNTFARIPIEFGDQREWVGLARRRSAASVSAVPTQLGRSSAAKPSGPFRVLDVDTRVPIAGILSPDGSRVVEQDSRGLVVRTLATGNERVVFVIRDAPAGELMYRVATPVWSPDGKAIAFFAQDRRVSDGIGNPMAMANTLLVVSADGGESHKVCTLPAAPPVVAILEWTARGEILYRVGMRVGARGGGGVTPGTGAEFWVVPAKGGEPWKSFTMPTESPANVGNTTPDGRHIIVVRSEKLVDIDLASGVARDLSLGIGAAYPRISPDGKLVAYLSRQDGPWAAYVSPLDGAPIRSAVRVADLPARHDAPPSLGVAQGIRWYPNGVLTLDYQDTETNLYRVDLDATSGRPAGGPQRLPLDLDAMEPIVSPDGKRVLFVLPVSRQSPRSAVFVMPADGGKPLQVAQLPAAQQVSRQIGGTFGWLSNEEMFVAGQGPALQSVSVTSGTAVAVPNSAPLGSSVLLVQSAADVGRVESVGAPARVGRRFQYIPTRNAILFEAIDQYGIPNLVMRDLANGKDRVVWNREPTVAAGPGEWQVSPDGRLLAYWGVPFGTTFEAGNEPAAKDTPSALNIMSLDGGVTTSHLRSLGPNGYGLVWAADSRHILYVTGSSTLDSQSTRVLDTETGTFQLLFDEPLGVSLGIKDGWMGRWAWSPDNMFLLFDATGQVTHRFRWDGVTYDAAKKLSVKGGRP